MSFNIVNNLNFIVGEYKEFYFIGKNGIPPYTYGIVDYFEGILPDGLSLSVTEENVFRIIGSTISEGVYPFIIRTTDDNAEFVDTSFVINVINSTTPTPTPTPTVTPTD